MQNPPGPDQQREFRCEHCEGLIRIPANLPSTTGPCPHCANTITSPGPDEDYTAEQIPFPSPFTEEDSIPILDSQILDDDENVSKQTKRPYLAVVIGLFVLVAITVAGIFALRTMKKNTAAPIDDTTAESESVQEAQYIRIGWKKDAFEVLDNFMKGRTVPEKMPHVLHSDSISGKIEAFYGDQPINDSDTPAEAFSVFNLSEADKKRGLFMLVFDQPPQFSMREFFRPLASLEVQYGLTEADLLLTSMARVSNFAIDPMRVHAFFKRTPEGLKLDWETYAQTKYSMLQKFIEDPQFGKKGVFRVFIMEDVQEQNFNIVTSRTYRIADPANVDHTARIVAQVDSDVGRALSAINWVGMEEKKPETRTATVELEWRGNQKQPILAIRRVLCWEFMGLGGTEMPIKKKDSTTEDS